MSKKALRAKSVDLLVALDWLEDTHPELMRKKVDPYSVTRLDDCVYTKYLPAEWLTALTARLPHVMVKFSTMGGVGKSTYIRPTFNRFTIGKLLEFLALEDEVNVDHHTRLLKEVDPKYWIVMPTDGSKPRNPLRIPKEKHFWNSHPHLGLASSVRVFIHHAWEMLFNGTLPTGWELVVPLNGTIQTLTYYDENPYYQVSVHWPTGEVWNRRRRLLANITEQLPRQFRKAWSAGVMNPITFRNPTPIGFPGQVSVFTGFELTMEMVDTWREAGSPSPATTAASHPNVAT